jgi:trimeric autotransporter adhesin
MKKLHTLLAFVITLITFAQAPQGFNYQATVRNSTGALIVNQIVLVKFNIYQNTAPGTLVYSENQSTNTDDLGHIALVVGQGTATTGTFSSINWGAGNYYLGIELNSGSGYVTMGTTQLLSVPYALYSQNAGSAMVPTIQQVLDSGNIATKTTNTTEGSSLRINTVGGSTSGEYYYGIRSHIDGTNGNNRGILAASNGISTGTNTGLSSYASNAATNTSIYARAYDATTGSNFGIYGLANGTTGLNNRGVQGVADGINSLGRNTGTLGYATNSTQLNNGLLGSAYGNTANNYGVWGIGYGAIDGKDNRGVMGYSITTTPTGLNYGISGWAGGSEVFNIAVGAYSDSGPSTSGTNYGVSARASSVTTTGTNYGIYSEASNGATNYAGFFNGNVTITGNFVQPSDRKLKKDIKPFVSALEKINALSPVTYYYKNEKESGINLPTNLQYGFIAQDLETVFPELVTNQVINLSTTGNGGNKKASIDPDGKGLVSENEDATVTPNENKSKEEFKGINYTGLISVLTEAIKEQQVLILELKKQNELLKNRINIIENKLK